MDDKEILSLYLHRNEIAITETARKYDRYCRTIARNILGSEEDAAEAVNDTWLAAWEPEAMAMPQWASFMASTSLTPSGA